jgi:hypothetical protein
MSSFFSGTKEYEDERVSICSLLAELDPVNAKDYEAESSGITWSARLEMCQRRRETLDKESIWDEARSTSPSRW